MEFAPKTEFDRQVCPTCSAVYGSAYDFCPNDGAVLELPGVDELIGETLAQKYVIVERVGEGGMGRVYLAHHAQLKKKKFAIKILLGDLAADPMMRKRFEQEAESASRLQHPNVVSVLDFGKTKDGLLYIVMEYVAGEPLSRIIGRGPLPETRVVGITQQLCLGLAHAHSEGLVHRDFKPENVVFAANDGPDHPRILDFGLAIVHSADEASIRLTGSGLMVGTPCYTSPEQAQALVVDQRTDVFSLGVTVYEMLASMLPFAGDPIDVMYAHAKKLAPLICERNPNATVSPQMEAIVRKMMAKEPENRFGSAMEVYDALAAIADYPIPGLSPSSVRPTVDIKTPNDAIAEAELRATVPDMPQSEPDTTLDMPRVEPEERAKGKVLAIAVGAVLAIAVAIFALLHFSEPDKAAIENAAPIDELGASEASEQDPSPSIVEPPVIEERQGVESETPPDPTLPTTPEENRAEVPGPAATSTSRAEAEELARVERDRRRQARCESREQEMKAKEATPEAIVKENPTPTPEEEPNVIVKEDPLPEVIVKEDPAPKVIVKEDPTPKPPPRPRPAMSFDAVATIAKFSSRGSLSSSAVRRAVDRVLPKLRNCYKKAANSAQKNKLGSLKVRFQINELGRASHVVVGSYALRGLTGCVASTIKSVRTRVAPDVGTVSVSFSLRFTEKP